MKEKRGLSILDRTGWEIPKNHFSRGKKGSIPEWSENENKHCKGQVQFQNRIRIGCSFISDPPLWHQTPVEQNTSTIENDVKRKERDRDIRRGNILGNREWFLEKNEFQRVNLGYIPEWNGFRKKHHNDSWPSLKGVEGSSDPIWSLFLS